MKKLWILLIVSTLSLCSFSQEDTVCFSNTEILNIENHITDLETKTALQDSLIAELTKQNNQFREQAHLDSLLIAYQKQEIGLLKHSVDLHLDLVKTTKRKWHQHPIIWFSFGLGTTAATSWIYSNIK